MIIIDNNLSPKLSAKLRFKYKNIEHVYDLCLGKTSDIEIWNRAKTENGAILTKDGDFFHLYNAFGHPPKVIWIRSGNVTTQYIVLLMINNAMQVIDFLSQDAYGLLELY